MKKWENLLTFSALVSAVILLNMLAARWFFRWDLTEDKRYSITPTTQNLLKNLDELVTIQVYFTGDLNADFRRLKNEIYLVLQDLIARRYKADKVMFFTDCQLWNSNGTQESLAGLWASYKAQIAPNAQLYLFDLVGYGKQPLAMPQKDVFLIGGWSDRIFEVLEAIQNGGSALAEVRKVEV